MTELDVAVGDGVGIGNVNEELLVTTLERTIKESMSTKPSMRKAAAIWLLCLVQYCGSSKTVKMRLKDAQAAFAKLLNDRDEIVQETGSRGLGLGELKASLCWSGLKAQTGGRQSVNSSRHCRF
jgi:hypothetical protein